MLIITLMNPLSTKHSNIAFLYKCLLSRYGIGMVYYKQEKFQLAETHYKRALSISPKNSVLLCNLAVVSTDLNSIILELEFSRLPPLGWWCVIVYIVSYRIAQPANLWRV